MVFPGASVDDTEKVAERLRGTVEESHVNVGAQSIGVTVSEDSVHIINNQWPRKHTENTEYSQIISVSSVDFVAIYHDLDSSRCPSSLTDQQHFSCINIVSRRRPA